MKKRYWVGIGVSAILIYLFLRSLETASVVQAFRDADLRFLAPAIAFYFAGVFVRAIRWRLLLKGIQPLGLRRLFVVLVVGYTANDILPLRAGEAVRVFMLWSKERIAPGATVATVLVERVFDGLALTGFLIAGALFIQVGESLVWFTRIAVVLFVAAVGGVFGMALAPTLTLRVTAFILAPLPARFREFALRVIRSFEEGLSILRSWDKTLLVLALSVAAWLLEAGVYYVLMFSFTFPPTLVAAVLGTAVASLASMVPSSPGYVGTFDMGLLQVLRGTFGVDASIAAAYTGLVHAALIVPVTILGLFFVWREGFSLRRIPSRKAYGEGATPEPPGQAEAAERSTF